MSPISSSSSFVIHKSEFPSEESFKKVIQQLSLLEEELSHKEYGSMWGESERTFEVKGNYLMVETYYVWSEVDDAFKKAGVDFKKLNSIYLDG